jgi:predicted Zn finger-like uncharacterized protein
MALATRCPNCQAMFRVVSDQLKLRGGLVRCGSCRHVFDAIGSLSYIEETALNAAAAAERAAARPPSASTPATREPVETRMDRSGASSVRSEVSAPQATAAGMDEVKRRAVQPATDAMHRHAPAPEPATPAPQVPAPTPVDPLAVPTLLAGKAEAVDHEIVEEIVVGPVIEEPETEASAPPQSRAETEAATISASRGRRRRAVSEAFASADTATTEADEEDVSFLREQAPMRGFSVVYGGGSLLLALLLLLQAAVVFRTELLTRWPELRPRLADVCEIYGCSVGWPTRAEQLAVIGTELQAVPGTDILELTAVIRNRAPFRMSLPAVEVTLTDTVNRTLARKVFAPVDYLSSGGEPSSRISEGLGPGSDIVVRIVFEARGLNAAGFVVYPFYL